MPDARTNLVAYLLWSATCYGEGVIAGRNHAAHGAQQGPFQDRAVFFCFCLSLLYGFEL